MDKDIIETPVIDRNLDSYKHFFDHGWSKRMFEAVKTSPLNDAICTLLLEWRFANGAHILPWLMAQSLKGFAEGEGNGSLRFQSDYSSGIVKGLVNKLDAQMQYSLNRDQRAKLKRAVAKIEKEASQNLKAARSKAVFPLAGYWNLLIHTTEFQLSILGTERNNYSSLFLAYEDFLSNVIRTKEPAYSSKDRKNQIDVAFARHFSDSLADFCWNHDEVILARLVRHTLAHNGGRFRANLEKYKDRFVEVTGTAEPILRGDLFVLTNGKIQITPDNTRYLFSVLKERVSKIVEELA